MIVSRADCYFSPVLHITGAKNVAAIKKELTVRLKALKARIPWGVLRLPAETYFEKPGQLTNNEHKALMQVIID